MDYRIGQLTLQPHRQLLDGSGPVAVGTKALNILSILAEAQGNLVTKGELMDAVWPDVTVEENALQVHVSALRKALGEDAARLIAVKGRGYRLDLAASPAGAPGNGTVPAAAIGSPSIVAVLPFTHRDGEGDLAILAADLTRNITRELGFEPYFEVIAAGTMAARRDKPIEHRALGSELGARYLIEGTLQRADEDVRLDVELIDTAVGRMLWSRGFVHKRPDAGSSHDQFAATVAAEMGAHIRQFEETQALAKPDTWSAWEHLLRAEAYFRRPGPDSWPKAIDEARSAIAAAPDLGMSHAVLARVLATQAAHIGKNLDGAPLVEMKTHLKLATALDGSNLVVINSLVTTCFALGDFEGCLRLARRAAELYPHATRAHQSLGIAYVALGRTADAIDAFTHLLSLTDGGRYEAFHALGRCYYHEGKLQEAQKNLDRALAIHPENLGALKWTAIVAACRGDEQAALAATRRLRELEPTWSIEDHARQIAWNKNLAERSTEAIAILRGLWARTEGDA